MLKRNARNSSAWFSNQDPSSKILECCLSLFVALNQSRNQSARKPLSSPPDCCVSTNGIPCSVSCRICSGTSSSTARAWRRCSRSAMFCSTMPTPAVATRRATPSSRPATVWTGGGGTSAPCPWRGGWGEDSLLIEHWHSVQMATGDKNVNL